MGVDLSGRRAGGGGGPLTVRSARVVPRVPSFQVDGGFWYRVPDHLEIELGSVVRIPLGGRRVRGFVVEVGERPGEGLRDVAAVTGDCPAFDAGLLETMTWVAHHYVAPLSTVLERSAPPNAPRSMAAGLPALPPSTGSAVRAGSAVYLLDRAGDYARLAGTVSTTLQHGSAIVVAPTGPEVEAVSSAITEAAPGRVVTVLPDTTAAQATRAWALARSTVGVALVGTARVSLWPVAGLRLAGAVEEGRRAMKERQTPTLHVREILRRRALVGRAGLVFAGPTPSLEAMALHPGVHRPQDRLRAWPLVEVVDRSQEAPGTGVLGPRARAALKAVAGQGGVAFVFTHRHGYAPAHRCAACRAVRRCPTCGSRPDQGDTCLRCGATLGACDQCGGRRFEPLGAGEGRVREEIARVLSPAAVGGVGDGRPVSVGTERDIPRLPPQDLAVAVDADGLVLGSNYRAAEEALRVLARVAGTVRSGRGRRMMVQTSRPDDPVIAALAQGDPLPYLTAEAVVRRDLGLPPSGELMVVEVRGEAQTADADLRQAAAGADVLGPADGPRGRRWLVRGADLDQPRAALRPAVQRWRDGGASVRIDVDPIDL